MTQLRTQTKEYWESSDFTLTEADVEQIYNYLLEVEKPQPLDSLTKVVIKQRITAEKNRLKPRLEGRIIYQPKKEYEPGDKLVFPGLDFAHGTVTATRPAVNPRFGAFAVVQVELEKSNGGTKQKEFAANLDLEDHPLNMGDGMEALNLEAPEPDEIFARFGDHLNERINEALHEHPEFIRLGGQWFVEGLLTEINVGHLHLSEAVLEVSEGGPLRTAEILMHLDLNPKITPEVQEFSLNHGLLQDDRFDEVAPPGQVLWYLRRMEPENVREIPDRLQLNQHAYDRALLNNRLLEIERELDDEWSDLTPPTIPRPVTVTITYPHRWAGTLPLASRVRPLFPLGRSQHQLITLIDDEANYAIDAWIVSEGRYIAGLGGWYRENKIPIGGFIKLEPGHEPGTAFISYGKRPKPRREYVRLAAIEDGRLSFSIEKRAIGCDFDDLLILGTDYVAALDALFRSSPNQNRTLASIIAEVMPSLASANPQQTVHAKTIYSAVNMLRRVTPGAVFAELVRHSAFVSVGDQYWQFDRSRWQS